MLKFGDKDIPSIFYGSVPVIKAYYGTELVWPSLPYDAEVEYLQSSGTQYIDLSFGFDPTDEVYSSFSIDTSQTTDKYIVSPIRWNTNNNRFALGVHQGGYCCGYGQQSTGGTKMSPTTANDGQIHQWTYSNKLFRVVDLSLTRNVSSITFGATSANLRLFYGYNSNTKGKLSSYKHIKNGQTMVDLIAVRFTNENNQPEGAIYDKVSKQLFRNKGTGNFTIGPDKI